MRNVGNGKTLAPGTAFASGSGRNYGITLNSVVIGTISAKCLTISAKHHDKTFGETFTFAGTEFTETGLVAWVDSSSHCAVLRRRGGC